MRLALRNGAKCHFYADTTPSYRGSVEPALVEGRKRDPAVLVDPTWDGRAFVSSKQVEGLPLEPYQEFYKRVKGAMRHGCEVGGLSLARHPERDDAAPVRPATRARRQPRLRRCAPHSFASANDKAYAEDALKTMGYVPEYEASADTSEKVRAALDSGGPRSGISSPTTSRPAIELLCLSRRGLGGIKPTSRCCLAGRPESRHYPA